MIGKVLFLYGTKDSARGVMAEGLARSLIENTGFVSAGLEYRATDQNAIEAMKEIGIDISDIPPRSISSRSFEDIDMVITVCAEARDNCPYLPGHIVRAHWGIPTPETAARLPTGGIMNGYRAVRDKLKFHIKELNSRISHDAIVS